MFYDVLIVFVVVVELSYYLHLNELQKLVNFVYLFWEGSLWKVLNFHNFKSYAFCFVLSCLH